MSALLEPWRKAADTWSDVYAGVEESDWELATPCQGWTVRDLVEHTLGWQAEGGALLGMATSRGDDWETIRTAYAAHLADEANLQGTVAEFAGIPKADLAALLVGDLLIHSWDLARSTGADETLPPAVVEAVHAGLQHMPPELRLGVNPLGQPMMGPAVDVPEDASVQARMLALSGRRS